MKSSQSERQEGTPKAGMRSLPRSIWALGFVSLLADISSEMIHSLLPVFLVSALGASMLSVGIIEGVAEATTLVTKLFSGALSDYFGKRKPLTVIGYGLAAITKPLFPLAGSIGWIFTARVIDRVGKGIRDAPRDALISDLAPPKMRGASYGLRQSLDTVGAFTGPLIAIALMALLAGNIRAVFWIAVIPAAMAVAVLIIYVKEPLSEQADNQQRPHIRFADILQADAVYWWFVLIAAILTLARFSEAFLVLRANDVGLSIKLVPLVLVVMSIAYALSAYPAGALSDRIGRHGIIAIGCLSLIVADIMLALASSVWIVMFAAIFWGLHMGLTRSLLAAMVADTAPPDLRGTAFGVLNLVSGMALLFASLIAGLLWDRYGPEATFFAGATFAGLALVGLIAGGRPRSDSR